MSNKFNDYFGGIGKKFNLGVEKARNSALSYLKGDIQCKMELELVSEQCIAQTINSLKNKSSYGNDGLSNKFLKRINCVLSQPLCIIVNKIITAGSIPKRWKNAIVSPLYKSGFHHLLTNYRPISLLPTMSKVLEKIIYNQTYQYLTENNLYANEQFGFRLGHSCIDCINKFYFDVQESMEKGNYLLSIFLDTSKAFDSISKNILLAKLRHYGIKGKAYDLFCNYFTDRTQTVKLGKFLSNEKNMEYGVGQGSILGPLVFNLITMDLFKITKYSKIIGYADDITIYHSYHNLVTAYSRIKYDMRIVIDWFRANKLTINMSKTKFMMFGKSQSCSGPSKLELDKNNIILRECSVKLLGITIDEKNTWVPHFDVLLGKLNQGIFSLKSTKFLLPTVVKLELYYSFIYSHLSYGIEIWGNSCTTTMLKKLQTIQNNCVRCISLLKKFDNTAIAMKQLKILNIKNIVKYHTLKFMYRYQNNTCPQLLHGILEKPISHNYNTRQKSSLTIVKPCLYSKGIELWNSIPLSIRNLSYQMFSKNVKKLLLNQQ